MGAMVGVLCTYLSRQPRYGRYAGCSVYLLSQLTVCRAPSVVSVCVPTFSRQYGRYCGCFVYLPAQPTIWALLWLFCVPTFSADSVSVMVGVQCTYLLGRQYWRYCGCSVYTYLLSRQYWRYCWCSVCLPSLQTVLAPWCWEGSGCGGKVPGLSGTRSGPRSDSRQTATTLWWKTPPASRRSGFTLDCSARRNTQM